MGIKLSLADVPLGPFAGSLITVYSARSKAANLHVSRQCGRLRTSDVRTADVPLETTMLKRLCSRCAAWGVWGRPGTGLGMFLGALGGTGLLYQLQSYTEPDEDDCWTDREAREAAALLRSEQDFGCDDEEEMEDGTSRREAREDAEELRGLIFAHWRGAGRSLHRAQAVLAHFPWMEEWAKPSLTAKMQYLETLRAQAARFIDPEEFVVAAAATALPMPELPRADPAFAVLGDDGRVAGTLVDLWRRWQSAAGRPWEGWGTRAYLSYEIVRGVRSNRKGYDAARAEAARLIESWEGQARAAATAADRAPRCRLTAHVPEASEADSRHGVRDFLDGLDTWTLGVLLTWTVDADWGRGVLTLEVPDLVAERLLSPASGLPCSPADAAPDLPERDHGPGGRPGVVRPGIFDDTPVFDRRPVTLDHIRALRTLTPGVDELYLVFSASGGAEVLPLGTIERRLAKGWRGVLIAGARDLPGSVIGPEEPEHSPEPEARDAQLPGRGQGVRDPYFGEGLGLVEGGRQTLRQTYGTEDRDVNLRLLALARGVHDLRSLDAGRPGGLPVAVWHGLLTEDRLDLAPFRQPGGDRWRSGSGLPLGPLAAVQLYTTNANPMIEGKGHSPLCRHAHERAVVTDDDLLTIVELMARTDFDWCSKCGGYAIRRLSDSQLSYYRAAHQLHDIKRRLDGESGNPGTETSTVIARLDDLAACQPGDETEWCSSDSWQWQDTIRELRRRVARSHAVVGPGEPVS
ncbi:hypothetical protein E4N62_38870 [Streptomyces sp. MNU76]|uniref:hypothetical protein n=1 Tax=Streptomyces sp. MNU76 TaxID=2560026 RepID=UPI001E40E7A1|nr:hypothetical protein [Streptomyces sp. MNU76]MCC9710684.1 hypothetical protein [Streptomyces sp. MNU76]